MSSPYDASTLTARNAGLLSDADIARAVEQTRLRSPTPTRDVALLYVLLATGARPLEIARLEIRDYLAADGSVIEESVMRHDVAVTGKARPLFFASGKATQSIDRYLLERRQRRLGTSHGAEFRGFEPRSRLFLSDMGAPFEIVRIGENRYLCRGIQHAYRTIFRRTGIPGISALRARRTLAARMLERGADEEQIGTVLGIGEKRAVRDLLPRRPEHLHAVVRELV